MQPDEGEYDREHEDQEYNEQKLAGRGKTRQRPNEEHKFSKEVRRSGDVVDEFGDEYEQEGIRQGIEGKGDVRYPDADAIRQKQFRKGIQPEEGEYDREHEGSEFTEQKLAGRGKALQSPGEEHKFSKAVRRPGDVVNEFGDEYEQEGIRHGIQGTGDLKHPTSESIRQKQIRKGLQPDEQFDDREFEDREIDEGELAGQRSGEEHKFSKDVRKPGDASEEFGDEYNQEGIRQGIKGIGDLVHPTSESIRQEQIRKDLKPDEEFDEREYAKQRPGKVHKFGKNVRKPEDEFDQEDISHGIKGTRNLPKSATDAIRQKHSRQGMHPDEEELKERELKGKGATGKRSDEEHKFSKAVRRPGNVVDEFGDEHEQEGIRHGIQGTGDFEHLDDERQKQIRKGMQPSETEFDRDHEDREFSEQEIARSKAAGQRPCEEHKFSKAVRKPEDAVDEFDNEYEQEGTRHGIKGKGDIGYPDTTAIKQEQIRKGMKPSEGEFDKEHEGREFSEQELAGREKAGQIPCEEHKFSKAVKKPGDAVDEFDNEYEQEGTRHGIKSKGDLTHPDSSFTGHKQSHKGMRPDEQFEESEFAEQKPGEEHKFGKGPHAHEGIHGERAQEYDAQGRKLKAGGYRESTYPQETIDKQGNYVKGKYYGEPEDESDEDDKHDDHKKPSRGRPDEEGKFGKSVKGTDKKHDEFEEGYTPEGMKHGIYGKDQTTQPGDVKKYQKDYPKGSRSDEQFEDIDEHAGLVPGEQVYRPSHGISDQDEEYKHSKYIKGPGRATDEFDSHHPQDYSSDLMKQRHSELEHPSDMRNRGSHGARTKDQFSEQQDQDVLSEKIKKYGSDIKSQSRGNQEFDPYNLPEGGLRESETVKEHESHLTRPGQTPDDGDQYEDSYEFDEDKKRFENAKEQQRSIKDRYKPHDEGRSNLPSGHPSQHYPEGTHDIEEAKHRQQFDASGRPICEVDEHGLPLSKSGDRRPQFTDSRLSEQDYESSIGIHTSPDKRQTSGDQPGDREQFMHSSQYSDRDVPMREGEEGKYSDDSRRGQYPGSGYDQDAGYLPGQQTHFGPGGKAHGEGVDPRTQTEKDLPIREEGYNDDRGIIDPNKQRIEMGSNIRSRYQDPSSYEQAKTPEGHQFSGRTHPGRQEHGTSDQDEHSNIPSDQRITTGKVEYDQYGKPIKFTKEGKPSRDYLEDIKQRYQRPDSDSHINEFEGAEGDSEVYIHGLGQMNTQDFEELK